VENEDCPKHWHVPVNKLENLPSSNLIPFAIVWSSCQSSFDIYDVSSNNEEYLITNKVPEITPGRSNRLGHRLTTAWLYLNLPPDAPKTLGQINPNLNNHHPNPMEISTTFWLPDITDRWCQQEETESNYVDLSNVVCGIFCIISDGIRLEASLSIGRDVIGWRQSKTTGATFRKKVIVR